ncbi:MAG: FumA C-terminus/TtdB family hydratase beta subunit [Eubacteriales bacterium]|nr:FumA C-terminus/TtdB family hydratase beta subunit [Eubacteriales bacterium]
MTELSTPLDINRIQKLCAGDSVALSGYAYTARDAAHARLFEMIRSNRALPITLKNSGIFYAGPCPDMPGRVINSCGPTTSSRMNAYAPLLYDMGISFVIGKGPVSDDVRDAIVRNKAVYFMAVGGAGALIASHITAAWDIAFPELGPEAIREVAFDKVPLIVAIDCRGSSVFAR